MKIQKLTVLQVLQEGTRLNKSGYWQNILYFKIMCSLHTVVLCSKITKCVDVDIQVFISSKKKMQKFASEFTRVETS